MIEFKSDMFPAFPEEDNLINPGCYGKRLAEFLADRLAQRGITTSTPIAEDWGWMIGITDTKHVWIGCSNIDGEPGRFSVFIEPSRGYVRKWFKKINVRTIKDGLESKILDILQEETVSAKSRSCCRKNRNLSAHRCLKSPVLSKENAR